MKPASFFATATLVILPFFSLSNAQVAGLIDIHYRRSPQATDSQSQAATSDAPQSTSTSQAGSVTTEPATTSSQSLNPSPSSSSQHSSSVSSTIQPTSTAAPSTTAAPSSVRITSTDANGAPVTIVITATKTTSTSSSASASAPPAPSTSGVGGKSIAGMVVAGVLAVLGIVGFIWWKLTRKRFSGFDDAEAIKWPDLNDRDGNDSAQMQPIPNRSNVNTDSRVDLVPGAPPMAPYYDSQSVHASSVDLSQAPVEPRESYYDHTAPATYDGAYSESSEGGQRNSGFYDPYPGPVPQVFSPQADGHAAPDAGRRSPGPNVAYGARATSPGPAIAYGRSGSPGPNAAYRVASPGPGYTMRIASPGPAGYGARTASPAPSGYAPRTASPGPAVAFGQRTPSPGLNAAYRTG